MDVKHHVYLLTRRGLLQAISCKKNPANPFFQALMVISCFSLRKYCFNLHFCPLLGRSYCSLQCSSPSGSKGFYPSNFRSNSAAELSDFHPFSSMLSSRRHFALPTTSLKRRWATGSVQTDPGTKCVLDLSDIAMKTHTHTHTQTHTHKKTLLREEAEWLFKKVIPRTS